MLLSNRVIKLMRSPASVSTSFDDFKNTWQVARQLGYYWVSGEGYYSNAYDFISARTPVARTSR